MGAVVEVVPMCGISAPEIVMADMEIADLVTWTACQQVIDPSPSLGSSFYILNGLP